MTRHSDRSAASAALTCQASGAASRGSRSKATKIHNGVTSADTGREPGLSSLLQLGDQSDGCVCGVVAGTYVHGIFEQPEPRHALVTALASARGFNWVADLQAASDPYDKLADVIGSHVDLHQLPSIQKLVPGSA
jgi:adenosylcobyric acid synthase